MNTRTQLLYLALATSFLFSCNHKETVAEVQTHLIEISNEQFENDGMAVGKMEKTLFNDVVKATGSIVAMPNGMAKAWAPVNGIVKNIYCSNGQKVSKNEPLLEIGGNAVIEIQNEYAEAAVNFERTKSEFQRAKLLFDQQVSAEKEFISMQGNYKTSMAKYNALKMKIQSIGLSTTKIENADFVASYTIQSPIDGYISQLDAHIGSYIDAQTQLLEIVNPAMFQIKLSVFATDIQNLKKGQTVEFRTSKSDQLEHATLSTVGVTLNNESKTIDCYATIKGKSEQRPVVNEFVNAQIITSATLVHALPTEALIKTDAGHVVLLLNKKDKQKYSFDPVEVQVGRQSNGFSEIISGPIQGQILIKGMYNVVVN